MTTDNYCFYLQRRLIQTSQTGGQWYSDTSPFSISIPCYKVLVLYLQSLVLSHIVFRKIHTALRQKVQHCWFFFSKIWWISKALLGWVSWCCFGPVTWYGHDWSFSDGLLLRLNSVDDNVRLASLTIFKHLVSISSNFFIIYWSCGKISEFMCPWKAFTR